MEKKKEMEFIIIQMVIPMMVNGIKMLKMVTENTLIKMNIIMKEIFKMIKKMEKENFIVMECF